MARYFDLYEEAKHQGQLWHPSMCPDWYIGVYVHGTDSFTLDGSGNVSRWKDISGNGNHAINNVDTGDRPPIEEVCVARRCTTIVSTRTSGHYLYPVDVTTSFNVTGGCMVARYKDGVSSAFDNFTYFMGKHGVQFNEPRCLGDSGDDFYYDSDKGWNSKDFKGSNILGATKVCLPSGPAASFWWQDEVDLGSEAIVGINMFGGSWYDDRSWEGPVFGYAILKEPMYADGRENYVKEMTEGFLVWDSLLVPQNALLPSHKFYSRPPLIGD